MAVSGQLACVTSEPVSPTVTIAMSVRDAQSTLPQAIDSLVRQTYTDWELIAIDDGSTDGTAEILQRAAAQEPRIRAHHRGSSLGTGPRLNEILDLASGTLLARMDADDIAYPERLERQVGYLKSAPGIDVVGCALLVFGQGGRPIGKRPAPTSHHQICARPGARFFPLFHPTWLGRLDWFRRWRYAEDAVRCEDQDLLYRAHRTSAYGNLQEPLLGYREDRLAMANILRGRINFTRRTTRDLWQRGSRAAAIAAVGEQAAKGVLDTVAMGTGLDHRLLRHRARALTPAELARWRAVWSAVTCRS